MTPEQIQNLEAALSILRMVFGAPAEEEEPITDPYDDLDESVFLDDLEYDDDDEDVDVDEILAALYANEAQIATLSTERDAAVEALERANRIIREQNTRLQGAYEAAGNLHNALHGLSA